ncbi:MAG: molybdopterin-dependent oxidoreductase [Pseudomonadota bacterium]
MTHGDNPFTNDSPRAPIVGNFSKFELALANRNSGMPAEMLQADITPIGMHYLLNHFDIPIIDGNDWHVQVTGAQTGIKILTLDDLDRFETVEMAVTMECAGNGRAHLKPRPASMAWQKGAVSTARWGGVRLADVLAFCGIPNDVCEIAFIGADQGSDRARIEPFARSLPAKMAMQSQALLATHMNGQVLLPQHGFPLRLIMPGWYGMASIKWLQEIRILKKEFDGFHQVHGYRLRVSGDDPGAPITTLKVNSAICPPGIPDWYTRARLVDAGEISLMGRAWSGGGVRIVKVEIMINDQIIAADLQQNDDPFAWSKWTAVWHAKPGTYSISCKAQDEDDNTQPDTPDWNVGGFCNNAPATIQVIVRTKE